MRGAPVDASVSQGGGTGITCWGFSLGAAATGSAESGSGVRMAAAASMRLRPRESRTSAAVAGSRLEGAGQTDQTKDSSVNLHGGTPLLAIVCLLPECRRPKREASPLCMDTPIGGILMGRRAWVPLSTGHPRPYQPGAWASSIPVFKMEAELDTSITPGRGHQQRQQRRVSDERAKPAPVVLSVSPPRAPGKISLRGPGHPSRLSHRSRSPTAISARSRLARARSVNALIVLNRSLVVVPFGVGLALLAFALRRPLGGGLSSWSTS